MVFLPFNKPLCRQRSNMGYPLFDGFCLMGRYGLDNAEDTCSVSCHLLMFFAIIADQRNQGTNCTPVDIKTFVPAFHSSTIEKYHFSSLSSHTVRIFLSSNSLWGISTIYSLNIPQNNNKTPTFSTKYLEIPSNIIIFARNQKCDNK